MVWEVMDMRVEGIRKKGRPRTRWKYVKNGDMKGKNLDEDMTTNRKQWRRLIRNGNPE
jgi:hypothetical protein